jgi:CRISPR-associated protein Cmr6
MRAAVPEYLGTSFDSAPPGHRFRLYLPLWDDGWAAAKDRLPVLQQVVPMQRFTRMAQSLAKRQAAVAATLPQEQVLVLTAWSTAPLSTGLGMEHPLENGHAFLDPYGLPYLPGSSVKGVLRRAAEELALHEEPGSGWTIAAVWWLLGFDVKSGFFTSDSENDAEAVREERQRWRQRFLSRGAGTDDGLPEAFMELIPLAADERDRYREEPVALLTRLQQDAGLRNSIHNRGSLELWDVLPVLPRDHQDLHIEIMNPHYRHYYQGDQPPGDWGDPNPVLYLALPAGTEHRFVVRLGPVGRLPSWFTEADPESGEPRWKRLVATAFAHAFTWLGFGAKTSQGFGLMSTRQQDAATTIEEVRLAPTTAGPATTEKPRPRPKRATGHPLQAKVDSFSFAEAGREGALALLQEIDAVTDRDLQKALVQQVAAKLPGNKDPRGRMLWREFPALERLRG